MEYAYNQLQLDYCRILELSSSFEFSVEKFKFCKLKRQDGVFQGGDYAYNHIQLGYCRILELSSNFEFSVEKVEIL